jgi:hypothetical protein
MTTRTDRCRLSPDEIVAPVTDHIARTLGPEVDPDDVAIHVDLVVRAIAEIYEGMDMHLPAISKSLRRNAALEAIRAGVPRADVCREHDISERTYYRLAARVAVRTKERA